MGQTLDSIAPLTELVRIIEIGEVRTRQGFVAVDEWLDNLGVDQVGNVWIARQDNHIVEARALRNGDRRFKIVAFRLFVRDVFDEQHQKDVVLVLAGIHAATQLIARSPKGRV